MKVKGSKRKPNKETQVQYKDDMRKKMIQHIISKEIKCCGDSDILHELVRDTARKLEKHVLGRVQSYHELIPAVSRNPCYTSFPF